MSAMLRRMLVGVVLLAVCAAGLTPASGTASVPAGALNVLDFGATPDDAIDDTAAIQDAIDSAAAQCAASSWCERAVVYLPAGEYRLRFSRAGKFTGLLLRERVELAGDGAGATVVRGIAATMPSSGDSRLILVESRTLLRDMTIDGDRASVTLPTTLTASSTLVRTKDGQQDCGFAGLEIRNQWAGGEKEGFGLSVQATRNCWVRDSSFHDNMGSGLSIGGNGDPSSRTVVERVDAYRNGYAADGVTDRRVGGMGITLYGTTAVTITGAMLHGNAGNGLNLEWASDVIVTDSSTFDNLDFGISTMGYGRDIVLRRIEAWNNGTGGQHVPATMSIRPGVALSPEGIAQSVEIVDSHFTQAPTAATIFVNATAGSNSGYGFPLIAIDSRDATSWTFRSRLDGKSDLRGEARAVLRYEGFSETPLNLLALPQWTRLGRAAKPVEDTTVTGRVSPKAYRLVSPVANGAWRASVPVDADLFSVRLRPKTTSTWTLRVTDGSRTYGQTTLHFTAADLWRGEWLTPEVLTTLPTSVQPKLLYVEIIGRTAGGELWVELPRVATMSP